MSKHNQKTDHKQARPTFNWGLFLGLASLAAAVYFGLRQSIPAEKSLELQQTPHLFLSAYVVNADMQPLEYKKDIITSRIGKIGDEPKKLEATFKGNKEYPVPPQLEYVRVVVRNDSQVPIVRIWLDFPVTYTLLMLLPPEISVESIAYSPLNPISLNPADRNATPLILSDTPAVLMPGDSFTFQFRNDSKAFAWFELPQNAWVMTSINDKKQLVDVHRVAVGFGMPMLVIAPFGQPTKHSKTKTNRQG